MAKKTSFSKHLVGGWVNGNLRWFKGLLSTEQKHRVQKIKILQTPLEKLDRCSGQMKSNLIFLAQVFLGLILEDSADVGCDVTWKS